MGRNQIRLPAGLLACTAAGALSIALTVTFARTLRDLLLSPKPLSGLYHVASEPVSKYDLLALVNDALGLGIRLEPDSSVRIDLSLDDSRFRIETGTVRPSWTMLVAELKHDYVERAYDAIYSPRRHRTSS